MTPTISVVIPTYNYGCFICDAVDSTLRQTLPAAEVIVVDDGSTDDTGERLKSFGARVRYVRQENGGISVARNTGIKLSRGDWIALLDSDDIWHPQKLERQWSVLQRRPDVGAISVDFRWFWNPLDIAVELERKYSGEARVESISQWKFVFGYHFSGGSGALINRACFDRVGLFDETLRAAEDLEMWVRLTNRYRLLRIRDPLVYMRVHANSLSTQSVVMEKNHRDAIETLFANQPRLRGHAIWKRIALARMHRNLASLHMDAREWRNALRSLRRSFLACPFTSGKTEPLKRVRMVVRSLRG